MQIKQAAFTLRLWTVKEYHKMAESGIFHPEERVELIAGQIVKMSAKGTIHTTTVRRIAHVLRDKLQGQVDVHTQDPIQLNDFSEPEPDIAVVKVDPLDYVDHHPTASEVYLIIEVADSSFKYDRETKGKAYAQSGILDYWLLDVNNRKLHVFREPTQEKYQSEVIFSQEAIISPLNFPGLMITIADMLPPVINKA